jgi:hypothetical protein
MQNRKHFRDGERNALVYPKLRELISTVLADVSPAVALDAFGSVDPDDATTGRRNSLQSCRRPSPRCVRCMRRP